MKVDANQLANEPWEKTTALLAVPGGRDAFFNRDLRGAGAYKIQNYVRSGGKYIGFCAGGYFGCSGIVFEPNSPIQVVGDRPLGFFPGICKGTAYAGFRYDSEDGSKALKITIESDAFKKQKSTEWVVESKLSSPYVYYNGGGYFPDADAYAESGDSEACEDKYKSKSYVNVLSRYPEGVTDPEDRTVSVEGAPAVIACHYGKGVAILTGVHIEFSSKAFDGTHGRTLKSEVLEKLEAGSYDRVDYARGKGYREDGGNAYVYCPD
ncbi:Biotin-protein ligase [Smittium culicis]|uniref:Biotin-protein ligase n=1 Tax=Smittium culicis TaxID=133412 RepID=A0A1R1WZH1_9FUNG|nr:Biotin-protein ligase [Smittium culicis]